VLALVHHPVMCCGRVPSGHAAEASSGFVNDLSLFDQAKSNHGLVRTRAPNVV